MDGDEFLQGSDGEARYYGMNFDVTQDKLRTQELEDARALLEHESRHDALTGLSNRRKLDEVFSECSQKRSDRIAVLHFDIDHFKQINDTLGHDAGDATVKHAADVLMRNTPEAAMVSQVGGDEFFVMLIDAPDDTVLGALAEKIIREMSQPFYYEAQECNIGTSISISATSNMRDHAGRTTLVEWHCLAPNPRSPLGKVSEQADKAFALKTCAIGRSEE